MRLGGHEGLQARDRAAEDERVHVVRALVRVDGLAGEATNEGEYDDPTR